VDTTGAPGINNRTAVGQGKKEKETLGGVAVVGSSALAGDRAR